MPRSALVVGLLALVTFAAAASAASAAPRGELLLGTCAETEPPQSIGDVAMIWRYRVTGGRMRVIERPDYVGTAPGFSCYSPSIAWSPDGLRYGVGGLTGVFVRRPGGPARRVSERVGRFSWMPDGSAIAVAEFAGPPGLMHVARDPLGRGPSRPLTGPLDMRGRFVLSPDARIVYYDRQIEQGKPSELAFTRRGGATATRIAPGVIDHISPDGRLLLAHDGAGLWAVRPQRNGSRRLLFPIEENGAVITAAWAPDGRWIAVAGFVDIGDPHYLRLISADGRVQRPIDLPDNITWLGSLSWRPQRSG
jgi:hypothetical protein